MTVLISQELKNIRVSATESIGRLSSSTYLRGRYVNLKKNTSYKYEVHAVGCEQKWIYVRTDPEEYHTC